MTETGQFTVATYNIHKCIGVDMRHSIARVAGVIKELDADVVALQEVVSRTRPRHEGDNEHDQANALGELLGMSVLMGPAIKTIWGVYGNAVLTRLPVLGSENYDLSCTDREPRACMRVDVEVGGRPVHVYNTHLGTSYGERCEQSRKLIEPAILRGSEPDRPQVLVGDFNDWFQGSASRLLGDHMVDVTRKLRPTYPGVLPFLRLDRVYVNEHVQCTEARPHASPLALIASDHTPVVARLALAA